MKSTFTQGERQAAPASWEGLKRNWACVPLHQTIGALLSGVPTSLWKPRGSRNPNRSSRPLRFSPGHWSSPTAPKSALAGDITDNLDKIVVDDWGQARVGPLEALRPRIESGKLLEENLYAELGEIAAGLKPGRENDCGNILFWHRGISLFDIALGHAIVEKAERLGVEQGLRFY